jgi:dTDP-4-amino-4,6-dideoxygalactose transaminase
VDNRDELIQFLRKKNIMAGIHYSTPVHAMPVYADCLPSVVILSQTEVLASRVLSLPIYPELADYEQDQVISAIREFNFI